MSTFNASRAVRESTLYPYEPVMRRLIAKRAEALGETSRATGDAVLSDKIAAKMCKISERQIRKARLEGMNPYLADHLCQKGLGIHPIEVFGFYGWITVESLHAEDIYEKRKPKEDAAGS